MSGYPAVFEAGSIQSTQMKARRIAAVIDFAISDMPPVPIWSNDQGNQIKQRFFPHSSMVVTNNLGALFSMVPLFTSGFFVFSDLRVRQVDSGLPQQFDRNFGPDCFQRPGGERHI